MIISYTQPPDIMALFVFIFLTSWLLILRLFAVFEVWIEENQIFFKKCSYQKPPSGEQTHSLYRLYIIRCRYVLCLNTLRTSAVKILCLNEIILKRIEFILARKYAIPVMIYGLYFMTTEITSITWLSFKARSVMKKKNILGAKWNNAILFF